MRNKEFYVPGVIIAGLVGAISALFETCCCLCGVLTAGVGLLAVHLVRRKSGGQPIELGEATLIGLFAGGITSLLAIAFKVIAHFSMQGYLTELQGRLGNDVQSIDLGQGGLGIIIGAIVSVFMHAFMGSAGGALAVPILRTGAGSGPAGAAPVA